jgi:hypothetical protein
MTKRTYNLLVTIAFGILSIPEIISIAAHEPILIGYINRAFIKLILIYAICGIESYFIKNIYFKVLGFIFTVILFWGIERYELYWSMGKEIMIISGIAISLNTLILGFIEKNKGLVNFLLIFYVLQRLLIFITPPNEILWWIDIIIISLITIVGLINIFNKEYK